LDMFSKCHIVGPVCDHNDWLWGPVTTASGPTTTNRGQIPELTIPPPHKFALEPLDFFSSLHIFLG